MEQQRFQLLINSITDYAIYMLDPEGQVATWNAGAERFKGYTADEIIGQHFSLFSRPRTAKPASPAGLRIAAAEGRFEAEGWRVRKDGTRFWANAVLDPVYDTTARTSALPRSPATSPPSAAGKALFDSEQRFRLLVEGVKDYAIYMLDTRGHRHQLERGRAEHQGLYGGRNRGAAFLPLLHGRGSRPGRAAIRAGNRFA